MLKRTVSILACGSALLLAEAGAIASSVPQRDTEEAATTFCQAIVSPGGGFSYWEFEGEARERVKLLLSKRLLANLDNRHDCFRNWARHQPPNSTDKPPGVDCCVFSASSEWSPTSFALQKSELMADGRRRVTVEYRFDSGDEHPRWHVAVYIVKEGRHYVVDDFEGGLDDPESGHWFVLAAEGPECKQGKWVFR